MNSRILKINGNSSIVVLVCQKPAVRTAWVEHEVHRAVRIPQDFGAIVLRDELPPATNYFKMRGKVIPSCP